MKFISRQIDKRIAAYQRELIDTHYKEVDNMYRQMRGWRHDYRNHIQMLKALAAKGDMNGKRTRLEGPVVCGRTGSGTDKVYQRTGGKSTAVCP